MSAIATRALAAYSRTLDRHPVKTQMASSAVIWSAGDVAAQSLENGMLRRMRTVTAEAQHDWRRTLVQTTYAALVWAPMAHHWYEVLDRGVLSIAKAGTRRFVAAKLGLEMCGPACVCKECCAWPHTRAYTPAHRHRIGLHPVSLVAFFGCVGLMNGETGAEVSSQIRVRGHTTVLPARVPGPPPHP